LTNLSDWESQLEKHFEELKILRNIEAPGHPIFGLEHNLSENERTDLIRSIRNHIKDKTPSKDHWLVWVVYASEMGYLYEGVQYWETFDRKTPGWQYDNRPFIKECFLAFNNKYNGLKPRGVWAKHFKIICWPIRHAILPPDLQKQLVRAMYFASSHLSEELLRIPRMFGDLIAQSACSMTSRFRQLIEDPQLVGQIAIALIAKGTEGSSLSQSLIHPSTLGRILKDLEARQRDRDFLREARNKAQKSIRFRNITGVERDTHSVEGDSTREVYAPIILDLSSILILRALPGEQWGLWLKLPNLSNVAVNFPELKDTLNNSRCRVTGHERWLARGRLLRGNQWIQLKSWPSLNTALLQFENNANLLNSLLKYCFIHPGPAWLFKISADGEEANLLRRPHVIAKQRYLLLFEDDRETNSLSIMPVKVQFDGVKALLIELPNTITAELNEELNSLGVEQTETIEVWPAGLTPAEWNGEENSEWLSTENPRINIRADHDITRYFLELGDSVLEIQPEHPGAALFIELPRLEVGQHLLNISAFKEDDDVPRQKTTMNIRIRDLRPWVPEDTSFNGFQVIVNPSKPTLEEFWGNQIEILIDGPTSWEVKVSLIFYKGNETILKETFDPLILPVSENAWSDHFNKFENSRLFEKFMKKYDLIDSCVLHLDAGELGTYKLHLERESKPLRWTISLRNNHYHLQLNDDSEAEAKVHVEFCKFEKPDDIIHRDPKMYLESAEPVSGGLYIARANDNVSTVIIPPRGRPDVFLTTEPNICKYERNAKNVVDILRRHNFWASAQLTGSMVALTLKKKILPVLEKEIFRLVCGENWARIESHYDESMVDKKLNSIEEGLSRLNEHKIFQEVIHDGMEKIQLLRPIEVVERLVGALEAQQSYRGQHLFKLSELALRIAMNLKDTTKIYDKTELSDLISNLVQNAPVITRITRATVLAVSSINAKSTFFTLGSSNRGWK
jgi:hypothetical protein